VPGASDAARQRAYDESEHNTHANCKCTPSNAWTRLNSHQRRDTWLNGTGSHSFTCHSHVDPACISQAFSRWRRPQGFVSKLRGTCWFNIRRRRPSQADRRKDHGHRHYRAARGEEGYAAGAVQRNARFAIAVLANITVSPTFSYTNDVRSFSSTSRL